MTMLPGVRAENKKTRTKIGKTQSVVIKSKRNIATDSEGGRIKRRLREKKATSASVINSTNKSHTIDPDGILSDTLGAADLFNGV